VKFAIRFLQCFDRNTSGTTETGEYVCESICAWCFKAECNKKTLKWVKMKVMVVIWHNRVRYYWLWSSMYAMQMDLYSRLTQLIKNAKKDGQIKKTKSYYEFRLNKLNEFSKQFYTNHQTLILHQCPRSHPCFADAVKDNFEKAYSHIYCSFGDEYETKFPVPVQVSGDQSINNTLVSTPVSTIQLPKLPVRRFFRKFCGLAIFLLQLCAANT